MWTSALVLNQDKLLLEDPMGLWNRHFEPKLRTALGGVGVGMKVAAVWLGYGCQGKCQKSGMCPNFCLRCNSDEVSAAMGRYQEKSGSSSRLISQDDYYTWLEENQGIFKLAIPVF